MKPSFCIASRRAAVSGMAGAPPCAPSVVVTAVSARAITITVTFLDLIISHAGIDGSVCREPPRYCSKRARA
jgi:hypothetical protein